MHVWTAERLVDEELARRLVREQFAPLPERTVELLSEGWDYVVHRVDDDWAFRFPRRAVVVPGTEREIAVLGRIAARLEVPVPTPVHVGAPSEEYPWPFYGARFLPGVEAGEAALDDDARAALARPLAGALRCLHASETFAAVGPHVPLDGNRRADMKLRVPRTRDALAELAAAGIWKASTDLDDVLSGAERLPAAEPTAVCHGDLHFRQILVDRGGLSGIIDWVDVCRSDPAIDLQIAWSFLPPPARDGFFAEYGEVSRQTQVRARVVAVSLSAMFARWAHVEDVPSVAAEALAGLARASAG
ncbi:MAG: phosphotransferase [Gaiellaceae bacterium]